MWRAAGDRVLVRRVPTSDAAELIGATALVWVAAEVASSFDDLAADLGLDTSTIGDAVELLLAAGWLTGVSE